MQDFAHPLLFCLSRTVSGDCTRILFGLINRLFEASIPVEVVSLGRAPTWMPCLAPLRTVSNWEEAVKGRSYAWIVVSNAHLVPMILPHSQATPMALFCQGYESYYYGSTLAELRQECPPLKRIKQLPIALLAASRSVQRLLKAQVGRDSHYVPVAIDQTELTSLPKAEPGPEFRVLLTGSPLAPYKGMCDAFEALSRLSGKLPLRTVLVSPETRPSEAWRAYGLEVEVHYRPSEVQKAAILSGCHAYCCSSWYEGHDLTTIESFAAGVPVVSTRNLGVDDYGREGENLLLVEPGSPEQLAAALQHLLIEPMVSQSLRERARAGIQGGYLWANTVQQFLTALAAIAPESATGGCINAAEMGERVLELEREGLHTPLPIHRLIESCADQLTQAQDEAQWRRLRGQMLPLLANPRAQYYPAARSVYDRAGMLLSGLSQCW